MPERPVYLYRQIEILVAETDIGAYRCFGYSLPGNVAVFAVFQTDTVSVQIGYTVFISAVSVRHQPRAMRKIEHAERLPHNLVGYMIIPAMKTRAVQAGDALVFGGRNAFAIVNAAQRKQFVLLERHVRINVQLHIFRFQGSNPYRDFYAAVAHRADICHQRIIGKRRHADIIHIQHVGSLGEVIIHREQQPVGKQRQIKTGIEVMLHFPFQIGIRISQFAQGHHRSAAHRHYPVGLRQTQGRVRVYPALITRQTVTHTYFQIIDLRKPLHEILFRHIPGRRYRREKAPFMIVAEFGRGVRTGIHRQHIAVGIGVVGASHERKQTGTLVIRVRPFPRAQCARLQIIKAE